VTKLEAMVKYREHRDLIFTAILTMQKAYPLLKEVKYGDADIICSMSLGEAIRLLEKMDDDIKNILVD